MKLAQTVRRSAAMQTSLVEEHASEDMFRSLSAQVRRVAPQVAPVLRAFEPSCLNRSDNVLDFPRRLAPTANHVPVRSAARTRFGTGQCGRHETLGEELIGAFETPELSTPEALCSLVFRFTRLTETELHYTQTMVLSSVRSDARCATAPHARTLTLTNSSPANRLALRDSVITTLHGRQVRAYRAFVIEGPWDSPVAPEDLLAQGWRIAPELLKRKKVSRQLVCLVGAKLFIGERNVRDEAGFPIRLQQKSCMHRVAD
jgi:hypothetical protein